MSSLSEVKERIKERADIAEVIGRHTKLTKTPRGYKACCPLPGHSEKTPSFNVDSSKNLYFCYGCNRGGDIFTFLQLVEGLSFMDALKELAERTGVELPKKGDWTPEQAAAMQEKKSELDHGYQMLDRAQKFYSKVLFESQLPEVKKAWDYLNSRKISREEVEDLGLGWAPSSGSAIADRLKSAEELQLAMKIDLVREGHGRRYDFFRDRLMIPIRDAKARVVGASGRTLGEVTSENPKYRNSSKSEWFQKDHTLYGLDRAQRIMRTEGYVCLVEGYFDQWAFHRNGVPAVALMGTALTQDHVQLLGRFCPTKEIVLVLDADKAGIASTQKSLPVLLEAKWDVKVFSGLEGKDPDEWLLENKLTGDQIKRRLMASPVGLTWWSEKIIEGAKREGVSRTHIFHRLVPIWTRCRDKGQKLELCDEIGRRLSFESGQVFDAMEDALRQQPAANPARPQNFQSARPAAPSNSAARRMALSSLLEKYLSELLLWWVRYWDVLTPQSLEAWIERETLVEDTVASPLVTYLKQQWVELGSVSTGSLEKFLETQGEGDTELLRSWILKGLVGGDNDFQPESDKVLNSFEELKMQLALQRIDEDLRRLHSELSQVAADATLSTQVLGQIQELNQKRQTLRISLENKK